MRAVVLTSYGAPEGLRLQEVDPPTPKEREVLVRVHATTVTAGDTEIRASKLPWLFWLPIRLWLGLFKPRKNTILGMELAGVIEAVGDNVERFQVGDAIFAASNMGLGAYAEYACVSADGIIARKPESLSFEQAAAVPVGGLSALGYLKKAGIEGAKTVLIRGASGSIGTFAVQLAKHFGAHVTGVCGPQGVDRVRSLGADEVIDYTHEDFFKNGKTYDIVLDVVGKLPISRCLRSVGAKGAYIRGTIPGLWESLVALWTWASSSKRVVMGDAGDSVEGLRFLGELLDAGTLEAVIDRSYAFDRIVEAHRYVEAGHKQGNVVVDVIARDVVEEVMPSNPPQKRGVV